MNFISVTGCHVRCHWMSRPTFATVTTLLAVAVLNKHKCRDNKTLNTLASECIFTRQNIFSHSPPRGGPSPARKRLVCCVHSTQHILVCVDVICKFVWGARVRARLHEINYNNYTPLPAAFNNKLIPATITISRAAVTRVL